MSRTKFVYCGEWVKSGGDAVICSDLQAHRCSSEAGPASGPASSDVPAASTPPTETLARRPRRKKCSAFALHQPTPGCPSCVGQEKEGVILTAGNLSVGNLSVERALF